MRTLPTSLTTRSNRIFPRVIISCLLLTGYLSNLLASPDEWVTKANDNNLSEWNFYVDANTSAADQSIVPPAEVALSCLSQVNISIGPAGFFVLTALTLVNAPQYPVNQYVVDIMGPLTNTVYCDQLGQELMVVVTETPTGNSCMSTIFVEDKLRPVLNCTPDTLPCNVDIATLNFEDYLEPVIDNCDPDPDVWYSYVIQNLPCNPNQFTQQILITWTATDNSGNSATCQDVIYLRKPALGEIVFPPDVSISCVNANIDPSATGEPTFEGEPIGVTCQYTVVHTDVVVPMCPGAKKILRTWTVMDWCTSGQVSDVQEILVIDNTPPVITCPASITVSTSFGVCTAKYTLPNPPVTDACSSPSQIDIDFFITGIPGIYSPGQMVTLGLGTTTITIRATDPCGNSSQCHYTVTVRDNLPPLIICPGNVTVECTASTAPSNTGTATAIDICDATPTITYSDVTTATQDCALGYIITRTWKATDDSGNTSICMQMIVLTDSTPPVITCPANVSVSCTASTAPANTGSATATDMCDVTPAITFTDATAGGACPQESIISRTWRATDNCGNSSTCVQLIFINDNVPPAITCPPDLTIECSAQMNPPATGTATATDNCDPTPTLTFSDVSVPTGPQVFTINRTWTATDDCGNSSTCIQFILVHDATPPVITCPSNLTVSCAASTLPAATGFATATDNCDTDLDIDFSDSVTGGACPQESTITRTWVATDDCGNSSTCIQTIVVDDSSAPLITCPSNITIQCTASTAPGNTGTATATDNCDGTPTVTFSDVTVGGACPQERTITRTWSATDDCGNVSTCVQTIIVDDSVAPIITCPGNVTILCTASTLPANTGTATATDNCDTTPAVTFSDATVAGGCPQERTITRTWSATDDCGNTSTCVQTIIVEDNLAPVITCPANVTIQCSEGTLPAVTGTATATDNCAPTTTVTFSDAVLDGACPVLLTITRTWTASDGCGNTSQCVQTIVVTDNTSPVITCPANITIECSASTAPANTGTPTTSDNCGTTPDLTFSDATVAGTCPQERTITRTWIATDSCGNTSTCNQIIFVDDSTAPLITCPANITIECNDSSAPGNTGTATATDNCDGTPTVSFSDVTMGAGCPQGFTITRTWVAIDDCGNSSNCVQVIIVDDNAAPLINCPANVTIQCTASSQPANTGSATATDVCDASLGITFTDAIAGGACPQEFTITRTWAATDDCGNVGTCNQTIVVDDSTAPICVANNITVSLTGAGSVTITGDQVGAGSSDACGPVTLSVTPNTFDCDDVGEHLVVLTVTDCPGNSSTCTATVTVVDDSSLEANCQNISIVLDGSGNASIDPEDIDNGSGAGCGGDITLMLSQTDFNCSNVGPNIVVLTVTDENGNTATCTAIVVVIDNVPPTITCPANLTVDCHTVTDPENTDQFGNATAIDNCPGVTITETHVINLNDCNVGTIVRTFTATDVGGNPATCSQTVTVSNPNPLDESDITWPTSPVSVNICNSTAPGNIPNGIPVIDPTALVCANATVTFSDAVQMIVDNNPATPCKIITRTWTIIDSCQPNGTFVFNQIINVQDMVPPLFTNINDMTKVANIQCVAAFTIIASATDCAGVSITNNSPYGTNTGANASGNYPIGVTTVIFTATDGCGNISTMDVVITVTDPIPTIIQCEKAVIFLPAETEITLPADTFVIFIEGNCTTGEDYIISFSGTNPFDTLHTYDCGDVGVSTFPLWFWNGDGTELLDSCTTADLDLRDPSDHCQDGLLLWGNIENEEGFPLSDVQVSITNAAMTPDTTDNSGQYQIDGLNENTGYSVAPFNDENHREGVSTLDLVLIQKHLLGKAKLSSPYKMIAADANKSGHLTALDLLEIRKLILGINSRFPHNTSWRFVDHAYSFPDPYNPFAPGFPETVWIDSVTGGIDTADFIAVKVGDVNGSYFLNKAAGEKIEARSSTEYNVKIRQAAPQKEGSEKWEVVGLPGQGYVDGLQFGLFVGDLSVEKGKEICSDILTPDQWYYNPETGYITVSWSSENPENLEGKVILSVPDMGTSLSQLEMETSPLNAESYLFEDDGIIIRKVSLSVDQVENGKSAEYSLFQNIPNPFNESTIIRFSLPDEETVKLVINDITGRQLIVHEIKCHAGINDFTIKNQDLGAPGIYYYTLYTLNASFTRKMSFTGN